MYLYILACDIWFTFRIKGWRRYVGNNVACHGIFTHFSLYVKMYLLEVFFHSFFKKLLCIAYVLHCTDYTCYLINNYHFPTLIFVDTFSLNFVLFRAIAFLVHKIMWNESSGWFLDRLASNMFWRLEKRWMPIAIQSQLSSNLLCNHVSITWIGIFQLQLTLTQK